MTDRKDTMTDEELHELERIREERSHRRIRIMRCEVYSRVVGYYRPVSGWNKGKREEFKDREYVEMPDEAHLR
jgi:anaerobic ribonucleoside-triphosphate reductase